MYSIQKSLIIGGTVYSRVYQFHFVQIDLSNPTHLVYPVHTERLKVFNSHVVDTW